MLLLLLLLMTFPPPPLPLLVVPGAVPGGRLPDGDRGGGEMGRRAETQAPRRVQVSSSGLHALSYRLLCHGMVREHGCNAFTLIP